MNRVRPFAELMLLAILATGASPGVLPGSEGAPRVQAARVPASEGPDLGLPGGATRTPGAPADQAGGEVASQRIRELSGGPAGTVLIGAALLAAVALILAVVIPW